jgi:hypothetical protein
VTGRDEHEQHKAHQSLLRTRLAGIDPARPGGPASAAGPTPEQVQERIMATTEHPIERTSARDDGPPADMGRGTRTRWLAAAAALVLVAAGVAGALALSGPDATTTTTTKAPPTAVTLAMPGGGTVRGSCIRFDVQFLRDMPVALAGTVTSITDTAVTLRVDKWYRASADQQRAEVVTLAVPSGQTSVALDGVDFSKGARYLLAATNGTVNGCGFSGPADPQLEAAYAEAFGA